MLGPHNAVDRLRRCVANRAARKRFLRRLRCALVALRQALLDQLHLAIVAARTALDQRHLRRQAHAVDVIASGAIVQRVQHDGELLVETDAVVGGEDAVVVRLDGDVRIEAERTLARHLGLGLADVLLVEQELPVQVADVDRVQIDLEGGYYSFDKLRHIVSYE